MARMPTLKRLFVCHPAQLCHVAAANPARNILRPSHGVQARRGGGRALRKARAGQCCHSIAFLGSNHGVILAGLTGTAVTYLHESWTSACHYHLRVNRHCATARSLPKLTAYPILAAPQLFPALARSAWLPSQQSRAGAYGRAPPVCHLATGNRMVRTYDLVSRPFVRSLSEPASLGSLSEPVFCSFAGSGYPRRHVFTAAFH
jgi:hypothetical protein